MRLLKRLFPLMLLVILAGGMMYRYRAVLVYLYQEVLIKGKSVAWIRSSSEVEFTSDGLALKGSVFLPRGKGRFPGIVLAHGGTTLGRKLTLYRLLGHALAQRGYVVLSFDFRGYGESEDPYVENVQEDLNFIKDINEAVSYLRSIESVDPENLHLVGHSFGAGVIIPAGIRDSRIRSIVAIAPGRRGHELFWADRASAKHYPRERLAQDMDIPQIQELPVETLNPLLEYLTIDTILNYPEHPPLLLIDGENEDSKDLKFLRKLSRKMTVPKMYVTIAHADHYFGTLRDDQGMHHIVTYWKDVVEDLVDTIDSWIQEHGKTK